MSIPESLESLIWRAIRNGLEETCDNCCYPTTESCPLKKLAKMADPSFRMDTFCTFDMDKVVSFIIRILTCDSSKARNDEYKTLGDE